MKQKRWGEKKKRKTKKARKNHIKFSSCLLHGLWHQQNRYTLSDQRIKKEKCLTGRKVRWSGWNLGGDVKNCIFKSNCRFESLKFQPFFTNFIPHKLQGDEKQHRAILHISYSNTSNREIFWLVRKENSKNVFIVLYFDGRLAFMLFTVSCCTYLWAFFSFCSSLSGFKNLSFIQFHIHECVSYITMWETQILILRYLRHKKRDSEFIWENYMTKIITRSGWEWAKNILRTK